jgi:hypothetical protein
LATKESELSSALVDSVQKATEIYEANVQRIMDTLSDALAGPNFNSLSDL